MAADGSIIIDTRINTAGFSKGATNLKSQFGALGSSVKKLGGLIATAFSVTAIVNFAKEAIELGSDLQEVQNVVDVTFTTMNDQLNEFAESAAKSAGLSQTMAKQYAGTFGAMAKSFQFSEAEAYEMATTLTQLSGDVASFYNLTQDSAYTKLKSVFTGETESLKDLGVVMTQTALDDFALRKGLSKTTSEMTEQEKVALRYQFVLEQLSGASGDFVRTSDSWANQTRLLTLQFDQLKATVGQGLINALTPAVKAINTLLAKFQALANKFLDFTKAVFGDAGGASSALLETAESASELAESIEDAGKAAQKYLAPFDEITKIGSDTEDNTDSAASAIIDAISGGSVTVGVDAQDNVSPVIDHIGEKLQELLAPLQSIDFSPLMGSLANLGVGFGELGEKISGALEWVWFNILTPLATWAIEDLAPASVDMLSAALDVLAAGADIVAAVVENLYTAAQPVFEWLGKEAVDFVNSLRDGYDKMADVLEENSSTIADIVSNLGEIFSEVWTKVQPALDGIAQGLKDAAGTTFDALLENLGLTLEGIEAITGALAAMLKGDWATAKDKLTDYFDTWIERFEVLLDWYEKMYKYDWFKNLMSAIDKWAKTGGDASSWYSAGPTASSYSMESPQLPYLAQGAVIPPNAPFAAILGDQKSGMNIEAPADLIRKIVREEIGDSAGMSAASTQEICDRLDRLIGAVEEIEVGDTTIGQAANRFNAKMAIMTGGNA